MQSALTIASQIDTPVKLSAFAMAIILGLASLASKQKNKEISKTLFKFCWPCLLLAVIFQSFDFMEKHDKAANTLYRIRVRVIGPSGTPMNDAKISNSAGGEQKRLDGGVELDIPASTLPTDRTIYLSASVTDSYLQGNKTVTLGDDLSPLISIPLTKDESALIWGIVKDEQGHALSDVEVSVVGNRDQHGRTSSNGQFSFPAHKAVGENARLHVEAVGYKPWEQYEPAGMSSIIVVLQRERVHR